MVSTNWMNCYGHGQEEQGCLPSIDLPGVETATAGHDDDTDVNRFSNTDLPDMILKHLSPPRPSLSAKSDNFLTKLESITLSSCGLTEYHLETLIFDHLQILVRRSLSNIKRVSVDRNNSESLQFITQRIQEYYHNHQRRQQQRCFSSNPDEIVSLECGRGRPPIARKSVGIHQSV
jgi:hypothetical protein